jgi:hypothetical protein
MEPTTISLIFRAPDLIKSVAGYIGLIESIEKKLEKLLRSDFNAGVRCLQELHSTSNQQEFLLKEAWRRFHTALSHETGERKALTYVGLALCQEHLGETTLATATLRELSCYKHIAKGSRFRLRLGGLYGFAENIRWKDIVVPSEEAVRQLAQQAREVVDARSTAGN